MLHRLYNELLNKDWFMTFIDFDSYVDAKERAYKEYEDRKAWAQDDGEYCESRIFLIRSYNC